jgi:hypothetical protein
MLRRVPEEYTVLTVLVWGSWIAQYSDGLQAGQLRNQGSILGRGKKFFSSPQHTDWLFVPPPSHPVGAGWHLRIRGSIPPLPHISAWLGA